jgi:hypothetical protein
VGAVSLACGDDEGSSTAPDADGGNNASSSGGSSGGSSSGGGGVDADPNLAPRWSVLLDAALSYVTHVAVSSDGVFVTGGSKSTSPDEWIIEKRSLDDGALVPSFGTGGILTIALPAQIAGPPKVVVDGADLYVGYGYETTFVGMPGSRLERRSAATGASLWSQPIVCFDGMTYDDQTLFVGCYGLLERRSKSDGALVPGFGDGGVVYEPPNVQYCRLFGFVRDNDSLITYGQIGTGGVSWRRLVDTRDRNTGARLWAHGSNQYGSINGGASDGTSVFLTGVDFGPWLLEKRALADGGAAPDFGEAGAIRGDVLQGAEQALVLRGGTVYVSSYQQSVGKNEWWVRAIDAKTGGPVTGFGATGTLLLHPGPINGNAVIDMAADDASLYLLGSLFRDVDGATEIEGYRLERRDRLTGAL